MRRRGPILLIAVLWLCQAGICNAQAPVHPNSSAKGAPMSHATGTFDVKVVPQEPAGQGQKPIGRMTIDKQWHGGLEGTSQVEMLTANTDVKGSAVYVAIEQFTGTLAGRKGTFLLYHTGLMTRGTPQLSVSVVPDSGIGQLAGLTGSLTIQIADGKHSYDFTYSLPESH